ncbi:Protein kinase C-like 1 [Perkinsus olseni]|uniref:phosphoenolpyruvate carboxykinase (ATP) n=3 Tax=Perkinsus olseni TaxID=32597 RepID=A0A7J6P844_PEROL|nr:Protein kinase C-like 1 [Perkinsus olseni]
MSDMLSDPHTFLELLKQQIEQNLKTHVGHSDAPVMSKSDAFDLSQFTSKVQFEKEMNEQGLKVETIFHNSAPPILYEQALKHEKGSFITSTGALAVNIKLKDEAFLTNRERAIDYLNTRDQLYVIDAFAGWCETYRIKIRVITSRAYHALFMQNMLVMPTPEQLKDFGHPDFIIYNAGCFPANRYTSGMTSSTSVCVHFQRREMVILGTEYAGEMKKGILTLMMYAMPMKMQLPLHSSCNVGREKGDVTLFFGLSGTGKTTLSADVNRDLLGDDEHVWSDTGVFNVEGGCYAKAIDLTHDNEPEIFDAIRFGAVLENVVFDSSTRVVDYHDTSVTENTRCAYPLSHIPNSIIPAVVDTHPSNVVLLCCDAFGVLPPVSVLDPDQVQYYFISGYTAKVAGTEQGITEPTATFSACFGAPFLVWHPVVYAEMLSHKIQKHKCTAYLLNTGWIGGGYGEGKRCSLKYTRKMIDAMHDGTLKAMVDDGEHNFDTLPLFNLKVPKSLPGVPEHILYPKDGWEDKEKFDATLTKLAKLFEQNFQEYADRCPQSVREAGPQVE